MNIVVKVGYQAKTGTMSRIFLYEDCICVGEMIRNICVNLGIDPDTHDGITRNVKVYLNANGEINSVSWKYNPNDSLYQVTKCKEMHLIIEKVA
jgi:hypothetical protein